MDPENEAHCDPGIDPDIFCRVYHRLKKNPSPPSYEIRYYPYRNIKNTLRVRGNRFQIRISDMLRDAPDFVMESIYEILLRKNFQIPEYTEARRRYNQYLAFQMTGEGRRPTSRSLKRIGPSGRRKGSFELNSRFDRLNRRYFRGTLAKPGLHWVERKSRRILGQYIAHQNEILINVALDHPLVPLSVVDFVLYHEMLHIFLGPKISKNGRKIVHHPEFRKKEREFENYFLADEFIRTHF